MKRKILFLALMLFFVAGCKKEVYSGDRVSIHPVATFTTVDITEIVVSNSKITGKVKIIFDEQYLKLIAMTNDIIDDEYKFSLGIYQDSEGDIINDTLIINNKIFSYKVGDLNQVSIVFEFKFTEYPSLRGYIHKEIWDPIIFSLMYVDDNSEVIHEITIFGAIREKKGQ
ncbi:hypothetical protein [Anaerobranca gottschalkii]|uniref:Uncharacterized protein n=1 Tax=Anaerobranca gottschalkii DSM 13577 TaxID=1120990 RepID=A0A1I0C4Z6_9FIRM|nr:hypothetical protein [Anaerobranca gottschalkii]SET14369.1 hypothetical protein SAMN03080614_10588 [Anaerobranca gottschalkii DSM 13577]